MDKNMLINIINRITFTTTIKTTAEKDGTVIQHMESRIKLPHPAPTPAPKPVLVEPVGFELVFEKNPHINIATIKPHDDPHCIVIMYKEYNEAGDLMTGKFDRNGNLISEYATMVYDWYETMLSFSPVFTAATNISVQHAAQMYIPKFLAAAMKAFKQNPDKFRLSIQIFNKQMTAFNAMLENIGKGITNVQSSLLHQLEEEKTEIKKYKEFLNMIQQTLTENDPEKYSGLIADIRGSLDYPVEERYPHINAGTPAPTHHRRRTRKEAQDAADNK